MSGKRRKNGSARASQSVARLSQDGFGKETEPRMAIMGMAPRVVTSVDEVRGGFERHCVVLDGDGTCSYEGSNCRQRCFPASPAPPIFRLTESQPFLLES